MTAKEELTVKIFERIVYNQLYSFLEKHKILAQINTDLEKNGSTIQAAIDQLEFIYHNLAQNKTVVSIFMDFSKTFDCIHYSKINFLPYSN